MMVGKECERKDHQEFKPQVSLMWTLPNYFPALFESVSSSMKMNSSIPYRLLVIYEIKYNVYENLWKLENTWKTSVNTIILKLSL